MIDRRLTQATLVAKVGVIFPAQAIERRRHYSRRVWATRNASLDKMIDEAIEAEHRIGSQARPGAVEHGRPQPDNLPGSEMTIAEAALRYGNAKVANCALVAAQRLADVALGSEPLQEPLSMWVQPLGCVTQSLGILDT